MDIFKHGLLNTFLKPEITGKIKKRNSFFDVSRILAESINEYLFDQIMVNIRGWGEIPCLITENTQDSLQN